MRVGSGIGPLIFSALSVDDITESIFWQASFNNLKLTKKRKLDFNNNIAKPLLSEDKNNSNFSSSCSISNSSSSSSVDNNYINSLINRSPPIRRNRNINITNIPVNTNNLSDRNAGYSIDDSRRVFNTHIMSYSALVNESEDYVSNDEEEDVENE